MLNRATESRPRDGIEVGADGAEVHQLPPPLPDRLAFASAPKGKEISALRLARVFDWPLPAVARGLLLNFTGLAMS
jgi:hypothetical protein